MKNHRFEVCDVFDFYNKLFRKCPSVFGSKVWYLNSSRWKLKTNGIICCANIFIWRVLFFSKFAIPKKRANPALKISIFERNFCLDHLENKKILEQQQQFFLWTSQIVRRLFTPNFLPLTQLFYFHFGLQPSRRLRDLEWNLTFFVFWQVIWQKFSAGFRKQLCYSNSSACELNKNAIISCASFIRWRVMICQKNSQLSPDLQNHGFQESHFFEIFISSWNNLIQAK